MACLLLVILIVIVIESLPDNRSRAVGLRA
jgi:hypothetical protein